MSQKEFLKYFLECKEIPNLDDKTVGILYQLCSEGIINETNDLSSECTYYVGLYYENKKQFDFMKKYYLSAIDDTNVNAMYRLGLYYQNKGKTRKMLKYLTMAVDYGNIDAMNVMADYYHYNDQYDDEITYRDMAAQNGDVNAMLTLALYYIFIKDYISAVKYYSMAANKGNISAMCELIDIYRKTKQYDKIFSYSLEILHHDRSSFSANLIVFKFCPYTGIRDYIFRLYSKIKEKRAIVKSKDLQIVECIKCSTN